MTWDEYFAPWASGDIKGQEMRGYEDGYKAGLGAEGYPDGSNLDTPYNHGFAEGYELGLLEKTPQ
jgi:hypothetical protein